MNFIHKKIYLIAGAFFLTIILLIGLVIFPLFKKIETDSQQLSQKKQAMDSLLQNWQSLENSKTDYEQMIQELNNQPALLDPAQAIKFILKVEDFADLTQNEENISVIPRANSSETIQQKENVLEFQISLMGSFPNLIKFLIYLENAPYYNNVKSLQINRLNESINGQKANAANISSVINLLVLQTDETSAK